MKKINPGHVLVAGCCLSLMLGAGFGIGITLKAADATRNSSGTYSIPNTFTAGTTISSSSVNSNFSDLGTEMTNSLERNGKGGMLAALRGADGTLAAPAFSWTSETGSGLFRNGTNDVRMSIGGAAVGFWGTAGLGIGTAAVPSVASDVTGSVTYRTEVNVAGAFRAANTPNTADAAVLLGSTNGNTPYVSAGRTGAGAESPLVLRTGETTRLTLGAAGNATFATPVIIGASGTAISQSNRGTASLTPAAINAQLCQTQNVTVTGAVANGECAYSLPAGGNVGLSISCTSSANLCTLTMCNPTVGSLTPSAGTYSCRVFNP